MLLSYLKSFLACLLNLHSVHSRLRTLNLGMILHHVLWFQDGLVSRRVLKPRQADWKLSKQAEEEKLKKCKKSPATQAWKALYTCIYKKVFSDFVMIYRMCVLYFFYCLTLATALTSQSRVYGAPICSINLLVEFWKALCRIAFFSQKEQIPKKFKYIFLNKNVFLQPNNTNVQEVYSI